MVVVVVVNLFLCYGKGGVISKHDCGVVIFFLCEKTARRQLKRRSKKGRISTKRENTRKQPKVHVRFAPIHTIYGMHYNWSYRTYCNRIIVILFYLFMT